MLNPVLEAGLPTLGQAQLAPPFWHCPQRCALALSCHLPSRGKEEPDMGDQPTNSFIAGRSSGKNTIPTAGSQNPQGHRLCPKERGGWTLDITPLAMGSYHLATQAPFQLGSSIQWWPCSSPGHHHPHSRGLDEDAEVCGVLGPAGSHKGWVPEGLRGWWMYCRRWRHRRCGRSGQQHPC